MLMARQSISVLAKDYVTEYIYIHTHIGKGIKRSNACGQKDQQEFSFTFFSSSKFAIVDRYKFPLCLVCPKKRLYEKQIQVGEVA